MREKIEDNIELVLGGICALVVLGLIGVAVFVNTRTGTEGPCTVQSKDRASGDNGPSMRIYTDCGVFSVEDSVLSTRFDSADLYASLTVEKTYRFDTRGLRIPFLSSFPNIITATEVNG